LAVLGHTASNGAVAAAASAEEEAAAEAAPPSGSPEELRGLGNRVVGGLRWKLLSQVAGQLSRTVVGIVLAHLLTPGQFGLAAMALVFTGLTTIFTDLSLGAALVQRPRITEEDRSTVFWTSLSAGFVVTAIWVGLSPLVARFFSSAAVEPLFAATGATALLYGFASTQTALLTRDLDFRSLELREIGATLVGGVGAVALALAGAGPWAIVGQNLFVAAASAVLLWRLSSWRPRLTYSRESFRTLGSFGVKTLGARLLSYANLYADNLLVGRFLGSVSLGVYSIAYNVMFLPATRIATPLQQVLFPAFARLQHDHAALRRSWIRGMQLVGAVNAPAFLGMAVVAPDFVPVVLGQRWLPAVPVLQLLCLAGVAQSVQTLNWSVLQAVGDSGRLLRFMVFSTVLTVGAFVAGLRWGVVGVAGLYAAARAILVVVYAWTTCRRVGLPLLDYGRGVARVASLALPMAVGAYLLRREFVAVHVSATPRLVLVVAAGAAAYLLLVRWRASDLLADIARLLAPRKDWSFGLLRRSRDAGDVRPLGALAGREGCLTPALRTLARRSALAVELDAPPLVDLPEELEVLVYDLVVEALANAEQHARATGVRIRLERNEQQLELAIVDDGAGGAVVYRGSRLARLRASVECCGGTLAFASPPGGGTTLAVSLPLPAEATALAAVAGGSTG
jgi:O-antigen/teichoic acid export membrane protein